LNIFSITDPLYKQEVTVLIGDHQDYFSYCKKRFSIDEILGPTTVGHLMHYSSEVTGEAFIVWVKETTDLVEFVNTLTHELMHATFAVLNFLGFKPHAASEEAYTYYMGFLLSSALSRHGLLTTPKRRTKKLKGR
jgi:hypothetical protein